MHALAEQNVLSAQDMVAEKPAANARLESSYGPLTLAGSGLYCPIKPEMHRDHERAERGAMEWLWVHGLIADRDSLQRFASYRITDLVCRAYPEIEVERLRLVMDWTLWVFLTDDQLDEELVDRSRLSARYELYGRILRDGSSSGRATGSERALADIRRRVLELGDARSLRRFVEYVTAWFDSLIWETANRMNGRQPTVHQYMRMREVTVGMYTEYALFDVTHGVQTNDVFWTDPDLNYLRASTANLLAWSNDIFSYAKETRLRDPHNLAKLIEGQCGLSLDNAIHRVVEMYNKEMVRFLESEQQLRRRARPELHVDAFVGVLRAWIRANLDWSFASSRYGLSTGTPDALFCTRATL
jgi:5-epi-alpha-selinene synthase